MTSMRWQVTALLVVAAFGLLCGCAGSTKVAARAKSGSTSSSTRASAGVDALPPCPTVRRTAPVAGGLPALRLPCLGSGPAVRLSDLRGRPMVLNVWAAWCTNCDREMPIMAAVQDTAGDRLRFFGVHYKAPRGYGLQSAVDFGVTFPSVQDEDGDLVVRDLHAYAPPPTLFVNADGRIAGRKIGEIRSRSELTALIRKNLGVTL
jgi:cytochrome c biogenesis protein CcmG/thiol:disulfide interchange protein DsbE